MENKHILATVFITFFLFSFVLFLIYVVYCFSFYDTYQEKKFVDNFNKGLYDYVYDNLEDSNRIDEDLYNYSVNLNFNEKSLIEIYEKYYKEYDKSDFIDSYLFSNRVQIDNFHFKSNIKTSLTKRRDLKYIRIDVRTANQKKTSFGVMRNISFETPENSKLIVDEKECSINENICHFDYLLGGLHTVFYENNNTVYFGLANVFDDNLKIVVSGLKSLVVVNSNNDDVEVIE